MDAQVHNKPDKIAFSDHQIDQTLISENALVILNKLHDHGYEAYLVGGAVRDLLLGQQPKDFDISTSANPEQIRKVFKNARIIGRRFKLVHIRFGREVIEVSTFRASHDEAEHTGQAVSSKEGRILRDNVYGDIDSDVWRRDFTVNALYYDAKKEVIYDYVDGMRDIEDKQLRLIGDPAMRFKEDPVRTIRALRFSAKLRFEINDALQANITRSGKLLKTVSPARLFDEMVKLFHGGYALHTYQLLQDYQFFSLFFPSTAKLLNQDDSHQYHGFIEKALSNTDVRVSQGLPVTPAFLIAVMLWPGVQNRVKNNKNLKKNPYDTYQKAVHEQIGEQVQSLTMPRRFSQMARDIWMLQLKFRHQKGRKPLNLLQHKRFRAAYDFHCLRAQSCHESLQASCQWWTDIQELEDKERLALVGVKEARKQKRKASTNKHRRYKSNRPRK